MPLALAAAHPAAEEVVGCPATIAGPTGVTLMRLALCKDAGVAGGSKDDLLEQGLAHLMEAGILIPHSYLDVVLKGQPL